MSSPKKPTNANATAPIMGSIFLGSEPHDTTNLFEPFCIK